MLMGSKYFWSFCILERNHYHTTAFTPRFTCLHATITCYQATRIDFVDLNTQSHTKS